MLVEEPAAAVRPVEAVAGTSGERGGIAGTAKPAAAARAEDRVSHGSSVTPPTGRSDCPANASASQRRTARVDEEQERQGAENEERRAAGAAGDPAADAARDGTGLAIAAAWRRVHVLSGGIFLSSVTRAGAEGTNAAGWCAEGRKPGYDGEGLTE